MEKQSLFTYIKSRFKHNKIMSIIIILYTLFCLTSCIYSFIALEIRNAFLSLLFSTFSFLIYLGEYLLKIKAGNLFIIILITICLGALLGCCYNFYSLIPFFDTILHGLSGFVFASLGFTIMELFIGKPSNKKTYFACLLFSITFSLAISVIWEVFEYTITNTLKFDMMEDTLINDFNSYLLSGNHNDLFVVNDINKTIIYYGNNQILTINGYIDIGLIDTLTDLIIHLTVTTIFTIISIISYFKFPKINELLIPTIKTKEANRT